MISRVLSCALALALAACADDRGAAPPPATGFTAPTGGVTNPGGGAGGGGAPAGGPGCGKPAKTQSGVQVSAGGHPRTYTLVVPDAYQPNVPYPVVMVLHGHGGNAAAARAQMDLEKQSGGRAIFVYPDAIKGGWDLDGNGDVLFFDTILFTLHNNTCIDNKRVFVTGFSNGAYMANQLGCRRGEKIRGVISHAGGGPYDTKGSYDGTGHLVCPQKAVASLVVHGQSDGTVAPSEGQKSLDHWTYANRCGRGTSRGAVSPCVSYDGCANPVGACLVPGLGHATWKEAGRVTWQFVDALR